MKRTILLLAIVLSLNTILSYAQDRDCRNSYTLTNKDTIRVFLVFAEMINDPYYDQDYSSWRKGEMPTTKDDWFEHNLAVGEYPDTYNTKYFYEASFGKYVVLGDYYPDLVQIPYDESYGNNGFTKVVDFFQNLPDEDIITANGYSFNSEDFDMWNCNTKIGLPKVKGSNDKIDMFMVIWRVHSNYSFGGGSISVGCYTETIKGKDGYMGRSAYVNRNANPAVGFRHEFAHGLLGGNNFHACANGAANRKVLAVQSGWSLLGGSGSRGKIENAWDRRRMEWQPDGSAYEIRAINPINQNIINTDLIYGEPFPENTQEFIKRDFSSTGDALRIKLPYLKSENTEIFDQYIWLENHQFETGYLDIHENNSTKGIYAYLQLGKETMTGTSTEVYGEFNNYIYPINGFGNFDMDFTVTKAGTLADTEEDYSFETYYSKATLGTMHIDSNMLNPFTGDHISSEPAYDFVDPNVIYGVEYYDEIFKGETLLSNSIIVDGVPMPPSDFCEPPPYTGSIAGTRHDAFVPGRKIGIGTNPASAPVYTYPTQYGYSTRPYGDPKAYDNRKIYLNGLSIEIIEQLANGEVKVKIRYDDYDVDSDVRWCGDIVLNEQVNLLENRSVKLDQGLSTTRPVDPIDFNG